MGYAATWKVLEGIIAEFREKSVTVPLEIMEDLRSARTMIRMMKNGACNEETIRKIEHYLVNLESYLVSEGQKMFSAKHVDEWLNRLSEASRNVADEGEEETRFVPGIPREQKWIRVKPSTELPVDKLVTLATELTLSCKILADDSLLIYGEDEQVKAIIKRMTVKRKPETRGH